MRILIYGAGVIGCLYAALLAEAGMDTAVYARGQRLVMLRESKVFCMPRESRQDKRMCASLTMSPPMIYTILFS